MDQEQARRAAANAEEARTLFRQRMEREGKLEEYLAKIAAERQSGKSRRQATYAVMRELGFKGAAQERALHRKAVAHGMRNWRREKLSADQKRYREKLRMEDFEEAIKDLPNRAPIEQEMDWVRVHPAMTRKKRQADKTQDVEVSKKDILSPGHGAAPSQYAANMLMHWVDNPGKFFELMVSEDKKEMNASGTGGGKNAELVDDDTSELESLIKSFPSAKQTA